MCNGLPVLDLVGCILLHLAAILDCLDGDLARKRQIEGTLLGRFLDYLKTNLVDILIPIAIAVGLVIQGSSLWWMIMMVVASVWKIAPQATREHIITRSLSNQPAWIKSSTAVPLFQDPHQRLNPADHTVFRMGIQLLNTLIGLPNQLLVTLLVVALTGVFILTPGQYLLVKKGLVGLISISYYGFFLLTLKMELNQIRDFNRS